jgi:ketosteroid isomerase-like protein
MDHASVIQKFYTCFANGDADGMVACYHEQVEFKDPVFGTLKGDDARNMWRMLIERSKGGLQITTSNIEANGLTGKANWVAVYNFGATGRKVTNRISAEFNFRDGKILRHTDHFNLWKWSAMALGIKGTLLGWTPFVQKAIQKQSLKLLESFKTRQQA